MVTSLQGADASAVMRTAMVGRAEVLDDFVKPNETKAHSEGSSNRGSDTAQNYCR